jgi:hypothetical protein
LGWEVKGILLMVDTQLCALAGIRVGHSYRMKSTGLLVFRLPDEAEQARCIEEVTELIANNVRHDGHKHYGCCYFNHVQLDSGKDVAAVHKYFPLPSHGFLQNVGSVKLDQLPDATRLRVAYSPPALQGPSKARPRSSLVAGVKLANAPQVRQLL